MLFPNGKQPIELGITILFFWFDYTYETKVIPLSSFLRSTVFEMENIRIHFWLCEEKLFFLKLWSHNTSLSQWITFEHVLMTIYRTK